jgi:hypothetical protein
MKIDMFETLPEEMVKLNFFSMNYDSILQFCNTNKKYSQYCFDEKFWEEYVKYNYDASILLQKQRIEISTYEYFDLRGELSDYDKKLTDVQMNEAVWLKLRSDISYNMTGSWRNVDWKIQQNT